MFCVSLPLLVAHAKAGTDVREDGVSSRLPHSLYCSSLSLKLPHVGRDQACESALLAIANICPHVPQSVLEPEVR
jgi:hypothetical protein